MANNERGVLAAATNVDIGNIETQARNTAESLAVQNIADVNSASGVHVRNGLPADDFESGADNGWNGDARVFTQEGLAAGYNEVYEVDSNAGADDKVVVIYAVTNASGNPVTTELEFETGTGGLIEILQLEGLLTDPEDTLMLADPIVYGPTQDGVINAYAEEAGDDEVILHYVVAEPTGTTLEESDRFLSTQ